MPQTIDPEIAALFKAKLAEARKADQADAPFPMDEQQAAVYHKARAELMQWVLEMLDVA